MRSSIATDWSAKESGTAVQEIFPGAGGGQLFVRVLRQLNLCQSRYSPHIAHSRKSRTLDIDGRRHPQVIRCPHEVIAVHIAAGCALATGRCGQFAFVHIDAGICRGELLARDPSK
jgi:hypothetical protein